MTTKYTFTALLAFAIAIAPRGEAMEEDVNAHLQLGSIPGNAEDNLQISETTLLGNQHDAADLNDPEEQYRLGSVYETGFGAPKNDKKARYWYKKAAEQGWVDAQHGLASMYKCGEGARQNSKKAFYWYQKAAEQGLAPAQYGLADMYAAGESVPQNFKLAFHWFEKSANQGCAPAQFSLAHMYENGFGIEKDLNQALFWYQLAAKNGDQEAKTRILEVIKEKMVTPHPMDFLNKKHHPQNNNHIPHYQSLLTQEKTGDQKAKEYLDTIRNFKGNKKKNIEENKLKKQHLAQAEKLLAAETAKITPSTPTMAPSLPTENALPAATSQSKKGKLSRGNNFKGSRRGKANKSNTPVSKGNSPFVTTQSKIEAEILISTTSTTTATTTSTATTSPLTIEPLKLTPFTPVEIPAEPYVPTESKREKIKTKGKVDKKKKEEKEKKSQWNFVGKKKKDKNTAEQDVVSKDPTDSTQLALRTPEMTENNQSFSLRKTIRNILKTSKEMLFLDENTIVKTLWGLHEAGEINLRNVVPTETGGFAVSDNKIVATKAGDSLITMVVHTHGAWWEKPAIIKDFVRFLRALSEKDQQEFHKAIYNIKKDKK